MAKVLIVDDAAFMRMMLKDVLVKNGYEIVGEATDGNEAFELKTGVQSPSSTK